MTIASTIKHFYQGDGQQQNKQKHVLVYSRGEFYIGHLTMMHCLHQSYQSILFSKKLACPETLEIEIEEKAVQSLKEKIMKR